MGERTVAVGVPVSSLVLRPVEGIDPGLSLVEVTGSVRAHRGGVRGDRRSLVHRSRHRTAGRRPTSWSAPPGPCSIWPASTRWSRIQFGRPIGSFQAIRHRLAETLVGIDMADAMLDAAWLDRSPGTAAMAKAVAGRQARTTARHCQQVLAGIGFTTEHPLHRSIRRTLVLDALLGNAPSLTRALGTEVISSSRLPTLPPL